MACFVCSELQIQHLISAEHHSICVSKELIFQQNQFFFSKTDIKAI